MDWNDFIKRIANFDRYQFYNFDSTRPEFSFSFDYMAGSRLPLRVTFDKAPHGPNHYTGVIDANRADELGQKWRPIIRQNLPQLFPRIEAACQGSDQASFAPKLFDILIGERNFTLYGEAYDGDYDLLVPRRDQVHHVDDA